MLSVSDLAAVLERGGNVRITNEGRTTAELAKLAKTAKDRAHLTIVVLFALTAGELVEIAAYGGGSVTFDFVSS